MRLVVPRRLAAAVAAVVTAAVTAAVTVGSPALAGADAGVTASAAAAHTHRVVVRPVTEDGHAAAGWSVTRERGGRVDCQGPSPAAVDSDIWSCFPTVEYAVSCWKSHHHTVLCLRDATTRELVRIRWTGTLTSVSPLRHRTPQDLVIARHHHCQIRFGGAWAQLPTHPHWAGDYSCARGDVYGPASGDGVNRSHQPWTVHLWKNGTKSRVVVRQVQTAYFVGTHH